jgi:hypothetical protein
MPAFVADGVFKRSIFMKKANKKLFMAVSVGVALALAAVGCGKNAEEENKTSNETDTADYGSSTDAESVNITPGSYEGEDTYINESFGFKMSLASDKWSFKTAEEIASDTGKSKADVDGVWSGEISPYTQSISYLAIAYNEETGSNIIVSYMCPALNQLETYLTSEEYVTKAAENYDGADTGKTDFAGETWDYLERNDLTDASQKILARSQDGIIVMITFTVVDQENCEGMFSGM